MRKYIHVYRGAITAPVNSKRHASMGDVYLCTQSKGKKKEGSFARKGSGNYTSKQGAVPLRL